MKDKLLEWFIKGEVGASSRVIAAKMAGVQILDKAHPSDPDDFKRCLKLLLFIPEIRLRLNEVSEISIYWKHLVNNWEIVEKSFMHEVSEWLEDGGYGKKATNTYYIMKNIFKKAEEEFRACDKNITQQPHGAIKTAPC